MSFQDPVPAPQQNAKFIVAAAACAIVVTMIVIEWLRRCPRLDAFPTVGSNGWLGSWSGQYLTSTAEMLQKGYDKYHSKPFKIAYQHRWVVILNKREHVEQVVKASEDDLSFFHALNEWLNLRYTVGDESNENSGRVVRWLSHLTRHTRTMYPDMREEIVTTFNELLDLNDGGSEWKSVPALSMVQQVISRASNRAFVGLPLCRNADYIGLNVRFSINVVKAGVSIGTLPKLMRPLAAHLLARIVTREKARALKHLGPVIENRLTYLKKYGNAWTEKPNDLLSWLIDEGEGPGLTIEGLVLRVLMVNTSAIHNSAHSFTHALYYLAANPQYIQPLREEVETVIEEEGWTKDGLDKMTKIDSFLKECQRLEGVNSLAIKRKATKDFTFSDGTFIPKGTMIGIATRSLHLDDNLYENARAFEPFRFDAMQSEDKVDIKYRLTSTGMEYLPFGHGKHACPGRFFAAMEMMIMLAHIVITYDVQLEDQATRPASLFVGTTVLADPRAKVLFKKRVN
ncbi:cytochrome P450 [Chiua virens]|nr:cytochrome P450 [Chiua virens]